LPDDARGAARFVARSPGVLAGLACATEAFAQVDATVDVRWSAADGDEVLPGVPFGEVTGALGSMLTAERTALNFLCHLSGVATLTARFVAAAQPLRVWDTRKTTPGLRALEKAAVRAGGGHNHRGNLSDWVLLKDNHLARWGIEEAVAGARARWPARTVHVECQTAADVDAALAAGADAVLLDNMKPDEVRACVEQVDRAATDGVVARRPLVEISGGISLATIGDYATTGADFVSIGALTHSAAVLDIGLDVS
jgi:nicotinate-nucleotide pyrophosphorylase (carboxylating)